MWSKKKFVISKHEAHKQSLISKIKQESGKIQKSITKHVDYYVQSWNTEDEGKLATCNDCDVVVVSSHYILHCIDVQSVIPFNQYALHEYNTNDKSICSTLMDSEWFVAPCKHSLEHESIPQSVQEFDACNWRKPTLHKTDTIYILPIRSRRQIASKIDSKSTTKPPRKKRKLNAVNERDIDTSLLQLISEFVTAYFQLNVKVLDAITMSINDKENSANICVNNKTYDINTSELEHRTKYEVCDIIDAVLELYQNVDQNVDQTKSTLQDSGYCIVGITNEDIFEQDSGWGVLRGRAFGGSAVAVFSVYHYSKSNDKMVMLLNTMAHELLHCFGMDHCTFYLCVMNAWCDVIDEYKNHINETNDEITSVAAMHLCPIDLKKLDLIHPRLVIPTRYKMLHAFYHKNGMNQQKEWIENVLSCCEAKV